MIPATPVAPVWKNGRFAVVVAALFVAQAGLILVFGARFVPPAPVAASPVHFSVWTGAVSEEELMRTYFVGDPDIFLTPNSHGFSGRAWMNEPPAQYHPTNQLEQPVWLEFTNDLSGKFRLVPDADNSPSPDPLAELKAVPEAEPLPVFLPPRVLPTQSGFAIEGNAAERLRGGAPALENWPGSVQFPLLTNSVVQIAITAAGDVIAARLLTRSGSPEADVDALAKARALEFRPSSQPEVEWAQAIFEWHTAEPTNSLAPK